MFEQSLLYKHSKTEVLEWSKYHLICVIDRLNQIFIVMLNMILLLNAIGIKNKKNYDYINICLLIIHYT